MTVDDLKEMVEAQIEMERSVMEVAEEYGVRGALEDSYQRITCWCTMKQWLNSIEEFEEE